MHPTTQYPADTLMEGVGSFLTEALSQMPTASLATTGKGFGREDQEAHPDQSVNYPGHRVIKQYFCDS